MPSHFEKQAHQPGIHGVLGVGVMAAKELVVTPVRALDGTAAAISYP
jgi:hypothetical protein